MISMYVCKYIMIITQDFTLESKCSCPYKEGESCTKDNGGGGGGGGGDGGKKKSKNHPGVVGIIILCV